jgi:hypothetical protein
LPPIASLVKHAQAVALCVGLYSLSQLSSATEFLEMGRAQHRSAHVAQVVQGIINYARWPQPSQQLNLCIVAPTEYADLLWQNQLAATLYLIHVQRMLIDNPQLEEDCQAIYLGKADSEQRRTLFNRVAGKPILTITESSQGCSEGSLFCLKIADEHVGFQVNLDAVARSGIRIHPNVLRLGKRLGSQQ